MKLFKPPKMTLNIHYPLISLNFVYYKIILLATIRCRLILAIWLYIIHKIYFQKLNYLVFNYNGGPYINVLKQSNQQYLQISSNSWFKSHIHELNFQSQISISYHLILFINFRDQHRRCLHRLPPPPHPFHASPVVLNANYGNGATSFHRLPFGRQAFHRTSSGRYNGWSTTSFGRMTIGWSFYWQINSDTMSTKCQ